MDKPPPQPLRLLIVEDNPGDAELMLLQLRRSGFEPDWQRVDTEPEFLSNLSPELDLILSDYSMPQFSGLHALELLKKSGLGIPFILVSATIGEETAVEAMRTGAADYLLKDRLARLGRAVGQVLEQKRLRDESKRAEESLVKLQRQHELILNSAGEGIYGLDLDGNIIFENPKAATLLGWTASELRGKPAHATIHHSHADGSSNPLESWVISICMRDGTTRRITNDVFWRKDGSSFRVDYVCAPIKDEEGRISGGIVTFKNITEQFAAEMRLKLQEQQYRLLFETNPSPMWVFDTKTLQILAVNEAAIAQYGYSRDEFLKLNLEDLQPKDVTGDQTTTKMEGSLHSPSHSNGQRRHIRKNASRILVEIYSGATVWNGIPARIVTAIDITKRKQAEERLVEQADIINRAHDAIIIRNFDDRRVIFWNSGAERLFGWTAVEMMGDVGESIFADPHQVETIMKTLLSSGEYRGEVKQVAKDGKALITEGCATLVRNVDGTPRSIVVICTDITEKKKLETQLLRAQRLESIGTLASGVAHDLNNILTPILMCAQTLRDQTNKEDMEAIVSLIEESAKRGASVVKQVLTFARGVEGERILINPSHLINEMAEIARKTFPKMMMITARYPEDVWSIEGDPTQLHQVLLNLTLNARDAMADSGTLTIAAENFNVDEHYAAMTPGAKAGPHVMLRVTDTGNGMRREIAEKIFDPFFTTKGVGKGTGLGLSTALGIIQSHGGFISVYSEIGKGTTFKAFLPAHAAQGIVRTSEHERESLKGNGELILVVDDEPNILRVTKMILESHNYKVVSANDAPEALSIFAPQPDSVRVVLTDLMMPYMDGVALVRAISKMKSNMAFIASTGQGEEARASELQALRVTQFLTKPYDSEKLLKAVRTALKESHTGSDGVIASAVTSTSYKSVNNPKLDALVAGVNNIPGKIP
jgi:two-component system cell cycle sensor histidine kinase/response regulator CckA